MIRKDYNVRTGNKMHRITEVIYVDEGTKEIYILDKYKEYKIILDPETREPLKHFSGCMFKSEYGNTFFRLTNSGFPRKIVDPHNGEKAFIKNNLLCSLKKNKYILDSNGNIDSADLLYKNKINLMMQFYDGSLEEIEKRKEELLLTKKEYTMLDYEDILCNRAMHTNENYFKDLKQLEYDYSFANIKAEMFCFENENIYQKIKKNNI